VFPFLGVMKALLVEPDPQIQPVINIELTQAASMMRMSLEKDQKSISME
jgi:hypothetical protein